MAEEFVDQLGPLVDGADEALEKVEAAKQAAHAAHAKVERLLRGQTIIFTGTATHEIRGGTLFRERCEFNSESGVVELVHYYVASDYFADPVSENRGNTLRVRTSDGRLWQLPLHGTQVMLTEQTAELVPS